MLGLALEGGGAKGAYQIGAYQALMELGYSFDAVAGTSIGAINAALIAQGDWERARDFWETTSTEDLFSEKDRAFLEVLNRQVGGDTLSLLRENVKAAVKNGGIDTGRIRAFLEKNLDPERLMQSPMDYGMVAISFPELHPLIAFKKEMTPENIVDHVLASATFPGFQQTAIGETKYLDGGFYDACPYNILLERGCDSVIAIRLHGFGLIRPPKEKDRVLAIEPSGSLGPIMSFDPATSHRNILMGYYDTMRLMRKLPGRQYTFTAGVDGLAAFLALPETVIRSAAGLLHISEEYPPRRALFEQILPALAGELHLAKSADYDTILLAMLEHCAAKAGIERLRYYTPVELQALCRPKEVPAPRRGLLPHREDAIELLLAELPVLAGE